MSHHTPDQSPVVVEAIAAELETLLKRKLPLPPRALCAALGWRFGSAAAAAVSLVPIIIYDGSGEDDSSLALALAARVVTHAGCSAENAGLVRAAASRFCGAFFLADAGRSGAVESAPHTLRKCAELLSTDRFDAA
jgi:hypothetical protein